MAKSHLGMRVEMDRCDGQNGKTSLDWSRAGGGHLRSNFAQVTGVIVSLHASCAIGDNIIFLGKHRYAMAALRTGRDLREAVKRESHYHFDGGRERERSCRACCPDMSDP